MTASINWTGYEAQLESLNPERREIAKQLAEALMEEGESPDRAMLRAIASMSMLDRYRRVDPQLVTDPDFSLAQPHGPEGESHGGRGGKDPLQYVQENEVADTVSMVDPPRRRSRRAHSQKNKESGPMEQTSPAARNSR